MRQFLIDELTPLERDNLDSYLKRTIKQGPMTGVFWLEVPTELLSESQRSHEDCEPFYLAVILDEKQLILELLVRSSTNLHCPCIDYATPEQRDFAFDFLETMLIEEQIKA